MDIREYENQDGSSPFTEWFDQLDAQAAAKVTTSMIRLGQGNTSNVKGVGSGVFELRIDFGPGYRIYFDKDGPEIVVLLGGGTKKRQQRDIKDAQYCWHDYKNRKKGKA